jgi:hypothetical protein
MGYLVSLNLHVLNQGNKSTFVVRNRKKVADLKPATNKVGNLVTGMYPMSHLCQTSYIRFQICNTAITWVTFRDPNRTNWKSYKDYLSVNLETILKNICMIRNTELAADQLQQAIISSYYNNFPAKSRKVPGWNKKLSGLTAKTRRLLT